MHAKPKEIRERPARLNVDEDEAKEADLEYITKPLMKKNLISKGLPAVRTGYQLKSTNVTDNANIWSSKRSQTYKLLRGSLMSQSQQATTA
ncbi:hypothetical protein QQF64_024734 [Cirrhinus molitorella]|uniref:Uncharacterized protein n=1 Tax=Cirrhinus molitorella TaxID=172907 RepID=A0ABR3NN21_9TELE